MRHFAVSEEDFVLDSASQTLIVTLEPVRPDYSETELIAGGWSMMRSLGLLRLVVKVELPGSEASLRN